MTIRIVSDEQGYYWEEGHDLADLELAIAALQRYVARRRNELQTALASQQPFKDDVIKSENYKP